MLRKLGALLPGIMVTLVVVNALAAPPKKKKKKHHAKPPKTAAPAPAPAPSASAGAAPADTAATDPDLYKPPAEPTAEPTPPSNPPPAEPENGDSSASTSSPSSDAEPSPAKEAPKPTTALPPFSIAALGGWASEAAARVGLGARLGYTLPFHIYIGATFIYHLGESENGANANFFYPGGEAGYELTFGSIVLRPYVGAGANVLHLSDATQGLTRAYPTVWPGVTAAYSFTPHVFVGADARYLFGAYSMFGIFATVGARF